MTPDVAVAILQAATFCVVLTYFVPRFYLACTRLRHNRDRLLPARLQQLLKSFAILLIAGWGFIGRLDTILHDGDEDLRWFSPPGDRWEDAYVWIVMLAAVIVYSWLYWRVERNTSYVFPVPKGGEEYAESEENVH